MPHFGRRNTTAVFALIGAFASADAQRAPVPLAELSHTSWTYADSIMLGGATRVLASPDGYLWLASTRGLIRFDGVRFSLIDSTHTPALRTRRPGMFAPRLADSRGEFWIVRPDGGVVTYRDGRFRVVVDSLFARETEVLELSNGQILLWARGERWVGEFKEDGRVDSLPLPPFQGTVSGLVRDTADGIWLGTQPSSLWHRVGNAWTVEEGPIRGTYPPLAPQLHSRDGSLWVTYQGTLYRRTSGSWTRIDDPEKRGVGLNARQLVEDRDGSVWIASTGSSLVRHRPDGVYEKFEPTDGLSGANSLSVYVNDIGVAWITTGAGLDRLRVAPVSAMPNPPRFPITSIDKVIRDVGGSAWVQADNGAGFGRFDGGPIRGTADPFTADSVKLPNAPASAYHALAPSAGGGVWVGPARGGLARVTTKGFDPVGERLGVPGQRIWRMLETRDGTLWLATLFEGLGRIDRGGRYTTMSLPGFARPGVSSFAEDARGHVWVSLDQHPDVFALDRDRVVHHIDANAGLRDTVLLLVPEAGDTLWGVGTGSLVRIIGDRAVTLSLPSISRLRGTTRIRRSGLPPLGGFIAKERLWIAGEGGIGHFSLAELHDAAGGGRTLVEPVTIAPPDGIAVPAIRAQTLDPVMPSGDGRFWIRTPTGIAMLDPSRLLVDPTPARPLIEEISIGGRRRALDNATEIGPNPERVQIRVTATSAAFPERIRLEHRLDGVETAWSPTGPERTVTYTQLRPGAYTFRVRVSNENGITTPNEATLAFRVLPAWYQAYWFLGAVILVVAAGGPAAVYGWLRHRGRAREAALQARFDAALAERTRVARELHDTLLQGFSGIALQLQTVLLTLEKSPHQAAQRLSRTLTLADTTLLDARRMIWDMRAPELEHNDLPSALEGAVKTAVADTPIAVRFQLRGRSRRLAPLVESTVLRIGREATTNAVRHANPSAIDIDLVYADEHIDLRVRDDGRGFASGDANEAVEHGHWGVSGMRERAARVGGAFDIRGTPGEGTIVSLRLPVELAPPRPINGQSA